MIVFSVVSTKGGVGKTTITAAIGAMMADLGLKVLLIDADYQPALSNYYWLDKQAPRGLGGLLTTGALLPDMVSSVRILPPPEADDDSAREARQVAQGRMLNPAGRLDIVYSDAPTGEAARWLDGRMDYFLRLHQVLRTPAVADQYDIVIIDTQGAAGKLQDAAAVAADRLILPVTPDALSIRAFIAETMQVLVRLSTSTTQMPQTQALLYRQTNTNNSRKHAAAVRQHYIELRGGVSVLETVIPQATAFERAATLHLPVHWIDQRANDQMHRLVWELVPQLEGISVQDVVAAVEGV